MSETVPEFEEVCDLALRATWKVDGPEVLVRTIADDYITAELRFPSNTVAIPRAELRMLVQNAAIRACDAYWVHVQVRARNKSTGFLDWVGQVDIHADYELAAR